MVLLSDDEWGLNPSELTIAEILKGRGYATGIFGKWHLGDQPVFLPTRHGFDEFFGLPYSHDIHPYHPRQEHFQFPPLPLYEGEKIIEHDPDADYLTRRITEKAVSFIDRHRKEPFFLYIPHPLPHAPLHVSPGFMETVPDSIRKILLKENNTIDYQTRRQLFPQAISEIDWSVGEVMKALKRNGLDDHTMVIFTTDNGPAIGSAKPLRGRKGSTYEGGMRVPAIVSWKGKVEGGKVCDELLTTMDLLPTFAFLAKAEVPDDRCIDGMNIWPIISGVEGAKSPHETFFFHRGNDLIAVRCGQWKLHRLGENEFELYNLEEDIAETIDMAEKHPDLVMKLNTIMDEFNREMGDSLKTRPQGKAILIE
jgi:arylsulfatase A-like enzyme